MEFLTPLNLLILITLTLFTFGSLSILAGLILLINRAYSSELKTLAAQTSRLVQKGLAEDIAALIGQASTLLNAVNDLIRSTAGVGFTLILVGFVLLNTAAFIAYQLVR
ncbi:MAG: hypothetical protein RML93_13810 [Anaerolineales bacterium]|nr:hypothetical protein [Anaerolineales bacterium]MCS7247787.1 hypothetical protein [Anaerolineales bacterium]MDW8161597.1 hypothetical protein [Anaerolineales bacterium]MDW8448350.1 hypothetical protein [Anaerolineales bacterium]